MPHSRNERKEYDALWRERNRKAIRKRQRAWYVAHRELCLKRAAECKQRAKARDSALSVLWSSQNTVYHGERPLLAFAASDSREAKTAGTDLLSRAVARIHETALPRSR